MPFSRSRSPVSMIRSPTISAWCTVNAPACRSIASTRVVFPWSTCATIATLRRLADFSSGTRVNFTVRRAFGPASADRTVWLGRSGASRSDLALAACPRSRRTLGSSASSCSTSSAPATTSCWSPSRRRPAPALAGHRRGRRRGPDRRLDVPRPRQGHQPAPRPARQRARPLRRVERRVGPGRRHRRGPRHAEPGGRGRPGRVLPLHLRRAPRLGRLPRGDAPAGQVAGADHPRALGPGRHRRLPRRPGAVG